MLADFRGVKKVYYNGSYHDSVYYGNDLMWEAFKEMEDVFKRSEVDLTGLDEQVWKGAVGADNDELEASISFGGSRLLFPQVSAVPAYVSINDWFVVVRPEDLTFIGRNFLFSKTLPPSYLERIFELPFPLGTYYDTDGELKNYKISLWFRKEE